MRLTLFDQAVQAAAQCEAYILACCEATLRNPPQCNPRWSDPEDFLDGVRYYARLDGHGLAIWTEDECKKHLHHFWNAYIKSVFSSRYMKAGKNLTASKFYKWILEARAEAVIRLTPVVVDAALPPAGGEETRSNERAGDRDCAAIAAPLNPNG